MNLNEEQKITFSRQTQVRRLEEKAKNLREKTEKLAAEAQQRGEILNIIVDDATSSVPPKNTVRSIVLQFRTGGFSVGTRLHYQENTFDKKSGKLAEDITGVAQKYKFDADHIMVIFDGASTNIAAAEKSGYNYVICACHTVENMIQKTLKNYMANNADLNTHYENFKAFLAISSRRRLNSTLHNKYTTYKSIKQILQTR